MFLDCDLSRFDRLRKVLGVQQSSSNSSTQINKNKICLNSIRNSTPSITTSSEMIDLEELRKDCWLGIPHKVRPLAWRILSVVILI